MVRAKFQVTEINHRHTHNAANTFAEVKLAPVYETGDGVNKSWSLATPSGQISLGITNPEAIKGFDLGKFYFVDFTPTE